MNPTLIAIGVACFVVGFLACLVITGWSSWRKSAGDSGIHDKEYRNVK
jgi:type II secretory pathway pseudopilin PulG